MFEPALLYLGLLASAEPNADGTAAHSWLKDRTFTLHVAHQNGITSWPYPPGCIAPAEALRYLVELTRDFLDPTQFDLLPFQVMCKSKELQLAFREGIGMQRSPADFRRVLEETIADAREAAYNYRPIPLLVDMIHAQVPADAAGQGAAPPRAARPRAGSWSASSRCV